MGDITQELLDELNTEYNDCIFKFEFDTHVTGAVDIKLKNTKCIDSYILNLNYDTLKEIEAWFKRRNIVIYYNNTASSFWSI